MAVGREYNSPLWVTLYANDSINFNLKVCLRPTAIGHRPSPIGHLVLPGLMADVKIFPEVFRCFTGILLEKFGEV